MFVMKASMSLCSPATITRSRPLPESICFRSISRCQASRSSSDRAPSATEKMTTARLSTDHLKNTMQKAMHMPMMTSASAKLAHGAPGRLVVDV
jgi:hypothetical protein